MSRSFHLVSGVIMLSCHCDKARNKGSGASLVQALACRGGLPVRHEGAWWRRSSAYRPALALTLVLVARYLTSQMIVIPICRFTLRCQKE